MTDLLVIILVCWAVQALASFAAPTVLVTRHLARPARRAIAIAGIGLAIALTFFAVPMLPTHRLFRTGAYFNDYPPLPTHTLMAVMALGLFAVILAHLVSVMWAGSRIPREAWRAWRWQAAILATAAAGIAAIFGWIPALLAGLIATVSIGGQFVLDVLTHFHRVANEPATEGLPPDMAKDRDRILRMLEEGRINPAEGAEILTAIAQSSPDPVGQPITRARKFAIAGALCVLVGFLLPWFSINPASELDRLMGGQSPFSGQNAQQFGGPPWVSFGMQDMRITVRGGDIGYGLGWICLAIPLAAVAIPLAFPALPQTNRKGLMALALAAGSIILLYLYTGNMLAATYGLYITLAGYGVVWMAAMRR